MLAIIANYVQALTWDTTVLYLYLFVGAGTPLYLALLPPGTTEPNGEYLYDKAIAKCRS